MLLWGKKKSTQVLCPFFNQVTWEGLLLSCLNSLYILGIRLSSNTCLPSIFSPSIYCFSLCSWVPLLYGTFYLTQSHLSLVLLSALLVSYPEPMPRPIARAFSFPMFPSRSFTVSGLTVKCFICFEFIFMNMTEGGCPVFSTPFNKKTTLCPLYILSSLVKDYLIV